MLCKPADYIANTTHYYKLPVTFGYCKVSIFVDIHAVAFVRILLYKHIAIIMLLIHFMT